MEQRALAPSRPRALAPSRPRAVDRRATVHHVSGFYRYAVIDGHCEKDQSLAVTRPRVPWEGQRRTVLRPLEYAALLTTARRDGPGSHALVALLGMIGLRIGEAIRVDITDLRTQSGYELLTITITITITGKGAKPGRHPAARPVRCGGPRRHRGPGCRAAAAQPAR